MASFLHTLLTTHGVPAMTDVRAQTLTPAVEAVVEGCVLISGLAFESGGLSAAHSLYNAFTPLASHMQPPQYHGELVHFGTCVEVFLEAHPPARRRDVFTFGHQVGLPETLEEIGLGNLSEETLWQVAERATATGETIHKARHPVTVDAVFHAIRAADDYGRKITATVPRTAYS
jgi:glycerol dehydrogenase